MTQLLHVLLAEAQTAGDDSLAYRLRRTGYRTTLAHDGEQVLATARTEPPDVIVLDMATPALNGQQTCRELKKLRPGLPVIIYSSGANDAEQAAAIDCEADGLVTKQADPALLMQKIVQVLGR